MCRGLRGGLLLLLPLSAAAQSGTDPQSGSVPNRDSRPFTSRSLDYEAGRALFQKNWVGAPASTGASDGLGPRYNARSCERCHPGGGRGRPLDPLRAGLADASLVFHLAVPDARFGLQLQPLALPGLGGEAELRVEYEEFELRLPDGEAVALRRPDYRALDRRGEPLSLALSPRLAPPLHGLGLLDAIPAAQIGALADPDDRDGDGISGRLPPAGGRFGWQAGEATLGGQNARALALDLGIGNPFYPDPYGDCTPRQAACRRFPAGDAAGGLEASAVLLATLRAYVAGLTAPSPPAGNADGRDLFAAAGCPACHRPAFQLPAGEIRPYSDLLLHDMGEGLANKGADGAVIPTEWRTAPLWGAGRGGPYLHDGRARSLVEAVLWHGGEAESARNGFMSMPRADRQALMDFVSGL